MLTSLAKVRGYVKSGDAKLLAGYTKGLGGSHHFQHLAVAVLRRQVDSRETCPVLVGAGGARPHQRPHYLRVPPLRRQLKRCRLGQLVPSGDHSLTVEFHQLLDHPHAALHRSYMGARVPILGARHHQTRMPLEEELGDLRVIVHSRGVDRLLALVVGRVYARAELEQKLAHLQLAGPRSQVKGGLFPQREDVYRGPVILDEKLDEVGVAVHRREVQRRPPHSRLGVYERFVGEQRVAHLKVAVLGCQVKGGSPLEVEHVHSRVVGEQGCDELHVAAVGGDQQRRPADRALPVQRLLNLGRRHPAYHLGQDLVVPGQRAVVESRLLGLLRLQRDVRPALEEGANNRSVVPGRADLRRLDLGRVMQPARAFVRQTVYVGGSRLRAPPFLHEFDQMSDHVRLAPPAGQMQRRFPVLRHQKPRKNDEFC